MRVAYLITSYRPPRQLLRLLHTLRRGQPDAPLVVHHDRFRSAWTPDLVAPVGGVDVRTSPGPMRWGDFSVIDATWRTLDWMMERRSFDWVVMLSEQDYPIAPLESLEEHLEASGADVMADAVPLDQIEDPILRMECNRRYNYRYVQLPSLHVMAKLPPRVRKAIADAANRANYAMHRLQPVVTVYRYPDPLPLRLGKRPRRSPFSPDFPCWYGTQWVALSRRAAEGLTTFVRTHSDYVHHFARTAQPDEAATLTVVCNDPTLQLRREDLHYTRFRPGEASPDVFVRGDLDELMASGRFFARKFDIDLDETILDALDDHVFAGAHR
ncbi:MAG TPA: beta-1,6-N-acetylglucosaminyltransferase [Acidimicrobiales bacterium]|nr:beta-1,6-N-acetylglucosaminyltransferase [Acidimicrobiales bacterium]